MRLGVNKLKIVDNVDMPTRSPLAAQRFYDPSALGPLINDALSRTQHCLSAHGHGDAIIYDLEATNDGFEGINDGIEDINDGFHPSMMMAPKP